MTTESTDQHPPIDPVESAIDAAVRRTNRMWIAFVAVILIVASICLTYFGTRTKTAEVGQAAGDDLAVRVQQACAQGGTVRQSLVATGACDQAAQVRDVAQGKPGATGATGQAGRDGRDGRDGAPGKPGPPGATGKAGPTPPCLMTSSRCQGRTGIPGRPGTPGADGRDGANGVDGQNGADGKDGLDGQDGATGQPGKDGADGKPGADGAAGKDGRGIAETDCVDDDTETGSHWVITYTDDTTSTSPGPCRVKPDQPTTTVPQLP